MIRLEEIERALTLFATYQVELSLYLHCDGQRFEIPIGDPEAAPPPRPRPARPFIPATPLATPIPIPPR